MLKIEKDAKLLIHLLYIYKNTLIAEYYKILGLEVKLKVKI